MRLSTLDFLYYKVEIPTHLFWYVIARSFSDVAISKQMLGMTEFFKLKGDNSDSKKMAVSTNVGQPLNLILNYEFLIFLITACISGY